jgi:hypothetical protein
MSKWGYIILGLLLPLTGIGQSIDIPKNQHENQIFIINPDSIPHVMIPEITIFSKPKNLSPKQLRQFNELEFKVKKVYPIAKLAAIKVEEYNRVYLSFKSERERKNYVKKIEKDLFAEYENEIRSMTISQGRILIKLIDRETGKSSFQIIKEFKGGFSAFIWQSVARIFGHNLKSEYDAVNEDRMIEYIVWEINEGII